MSRIRNVISLLLICLTLGNAAVLPVWALEVASPETEQTVPAQTLPAETLPEPVTEPPAEEATAPATEPVEQTEPVETAPAETEPPQPQPEATEAPEETEEPEQAEEEFPLYLQTDYPDTMFGNGTIASSGCSITSLAMVATYLTGHEYRPEELAGYFGGYVGNNMERLEYASDMLQLPWRKAENWHDALGDMKRGCVVIALMNAKSIFTDSQHFVVLTGLTEDGKVLVNDPYGPNYDRWDLKDGFAGGFDPLYISNGYSGSWIYDPSAVPEEPFIYVEEEKPYVEPRYPGIELTEEETELLARMVWVEAQGEPVEGQQAVAEVVLNRLASAEFQDTLKGVIYAEGQFRSTPHLKDAEPTQTQYEAIERALYGPYVLPIDVVFFAQYPVNKNVWGQIGGHTFCYAW